MICNKKNQWKDTVWILFLVRFTRGFIFVAWEQFEMRPFYQKAWVWKFQRIRLCALLLREILLHQRYILNLTKSNFCRIGEELPINERQYLFENGTLLLKSVGQSDGGEYTCTVVQGSNSVAQSVTVQVQGNTITMTLLSRCFFFYILQGAHLLHDTNPKEGLLKVLKSKSCLIGLKIWVFYNQNAINGENLNSKSQ